MTIPTLAGIHHLKLPVRDLKRSADWYGDVLGYRVTVEFVEQGELAGQQEGTRADADGGAERRRHRAVDAIGPPVGEEAQLGVGLREERLDVANRHRRGHPHQRAIGQDVRQRRVGPRLARIRGG
jgi:catechol 2,3-dioxygenase-like lactoylglutathione lyase family enzyme